MEDKKLTFGITIPTYWRPDGSTAANLAVVLHSILNQSYQDWKVYLIGDRYEHDDEFWELADIIPAEKRYAVNLTYAAERDAGIRGEALWHCGGAHANNVAIARQRADDIPVTCHLDDDDCWFNNHLKTLADVYQQLPEAVFVYTSAWQGGREYPSTKAGILDYNNTEIAGGGALIHSSASWRLDKMPLKYRQTQHCGADNDLWDRLSVYCKEHNYKTVFAPKVTLTKATRGKSVVERYYP